MTLEIKPNCRYGHGDLKHVTALESEKVGYVIPTTGGFLFTGHLYLCATCGYTEFFDDDLHSTFNGITTLADLANTKIENKQET